MRTRLLTKLAEKPWVGTKMILVPDLHELGWARCVTHEQLTGFLVKHDEAQTFLSGLKLASVYITTFLFRLCRKSNRRSGILAKRASKNNSM